MKRVLYKKYIKQQICAEVKNDKQSLCLLASIVSYILTFTLTALDPSVGYFMGILICLKLIAAIDLHLNQIIW